MNNSSAMSASDNPPLTFPERVSYCCNHVGSAAELARRIGISPAALTKYQTKGAEPGAFTLVKMAEASGVPIEWLATGKGTPNGSPEPTKPARDSLSPEDAGFTDRLRESLATIKRRFGVMPVQTPLSVERLKELLDGGRPNFEDVVALSRFPLLPLNYVLNGNNDREEDRKRGGDEYAFADLIQKLRAIDEKRRIPNWSSSPPKDKKYPPSWQAPLFELVASIYEKIEPKKLVMHTIADDSLYSTLPQGTIVLAVQEKSPTRPGFYVLSYQQDAKDPEESAFVARLSPGKTGLVASFDNGPENSLDVGKLNIIGRVILTVRLSGI